MSEINNTKITLSLDDELIKALENAENVIRFIAGSNNIDKLNYIWEKDTKILRLTLILKSTNENVIIKAVENGVGNTNNNYGYLRLISNNESGNILNNGLDSILCVGKNIIEIDLTELEINADIESDISQLFITGPNSYYSIVDNKFTIDSTEYTILDSTVADSIYKVDNDNFTINETSYFINPDAQVILNNGLTVALVNDNKFSLDDKNYIISSKFIMELLETTGNVSDDNKFTIENTVFTISEDYKNITCKFEGEKTTLENGNTRYEFNIFGDTFLVVKAKNNRVITIVRKIEGGGNNTIKILDNKFTIGSNQFSVTGNISNTVIICNIILEENIFDLTDKGSYIIDNKIVYKANKIVLTDDNFSLDDKNYLLNQREVIIVNNESEGSNDFEAEYYLVSNNSFTINNITYTKYWSNKNYLIISGNYKIDNNQFKIGDSIYTINSNVDLEESIKYLESIGIDTGSSIYLLNKDNEDTLVTKESYIKLLYKTIIDLEEDDIDEIYSFIDKNGQTVYRNTLFRVYNPEEVDIYLTKTKNYELVELKENVYGIGIVAGNFSIGGTIGYTDYSIINNKYNKVKTGKVRVSEIPSFQLKFVENTDIFNKDNTIISGEKLIEYTDTYSNNNTKDDTTYLSEELTIYFDSPGLYNEVVRCQKTINVVQAVDYNIPWQLILPETNDDIWTRFKEKEITGLNITKEIPVIVFNNPSSRKTAEIGIKTTDSNIATALGNNQFSLIYEHSLDYPSDSNPESNFNNYFSIDTENIYIKEINTTTINYYEIKIPIIYKNSNISGDKWAPCSGNTQELIKVTIKLNESLELGNYNSSFYIAGRSSNIPVPKIYEDLGSDINNYSSISPINEIKMTFLKPQNIRLIYEKGEEHYWIANKNSGISINNDVKDNNKNKYIDNRLSESININVNGDIEKNNIIIFSDLTKELWEKYGINSDELNIEDWKINILLPSTSLIIKTKKQIISFWYNLNGIQRKIINDDGELSGDLGEELIVNQNDIYKLFVSSNLKTRATLGNSNSTVMFAKGEGEDLVNFYKYVDLNPANTSEGVSIEFELNEGITEIKPEAFKNCIDLEKIIIPNTINTIGESAFENCINLKEVVLPSTLKKINKRAFYNCTNLLKVVIEEDNLEYIAPDSFDKSAIITSNSIVIIGQTLLKYSKNLSESVIDIKNLVEDTEIKTIASRAFDGCSNITNITIPGTVRYIGDNAFSGCTNLKEIFFEPVEEGTYNIPLTVGHQILDSEVRKSLLFDCNVEIVSLGRNIKYFTEVEDYMSVGDSLYSEIDWWDSTYKSKEGKIGYPNECGRDYNDGYENLDLGYTSIFRNLSSLITVEFKKGVEVIRDLEFYGCNNLSGDIELCDTIKEIGFKSFYKTKISSIKVNKESELSYIWTKAFMDCSSLSKINIQSSNLKKLGRLIFCNNTNLVAGDDWKSNDKDLTNTETWNKLFDNVKINLTNVDEIGNGLMFKTDIYDTWNNINNWTDLTFASVLILPNSEDSGKGWLIDYKTVGGYSVYPKDWERNNHKFYSDLIGICNDLSYNVICNQLFRFPPSLKYIGSNSFKKTLSDHSTVVFTGDNENILFRKNAFKDTSIYYVYSKMIKWRSKTTSENYDWFDLSDWCNYYTFENEFSNPLCGTTYLLSFQEDRNDVYLLGDNIHIGNKKENKKINIPDYSFYGWTKKDGSQYSIQGYVGSVGKKAFARSADYRGYLSGGLQFVELSGVEDIKEEAFKDQTELIRIEITDSPNLKSIGDDAFTGTYWLNQQPFYKDNVKKGDNYLSYNESGIFYLSVNNNDYFAYAWTGKQNRVGGDIIERDFNSVLGHKFLEKIDESNINLIGFSDLENLNGNNQVEIVTNKGDKEDNYFVLNESIKYIGENAFNGNSQIKKIELPESTEYIGDRAFNDCNNLSEISLTNKINYFGISAFGNTIIRSLRILKHINNTSITINNSFNNNSFEELILPNLFYWCTKVNLNSIESNPIQYSNRFYFGDASNPGDITIGGFNKEILNINFDDEEEFDGHIKKYSLCCSPYREIVLGDNTINTVEEYAFYNCRNLRKVTISESIVEIKDYAFYKFESEDDYLIVEFKGNIAPKISKNSFNKENTLFIIPENSNGYNENEYTLFIKVTDISETISGTYFNHEADNEIIIYDDSLDYKNTIKDIKVNTESKEDINNKVNSIASNNILYIAIKELNTETEEKLLDTVMIKTVDSADGEEIEVSVPIRYKKSETKRRELKFVNENLLLVDNSDYTVNTPIIHYSPIIPDFNININRRNYFSYPNINEISNIVYFGTNNISNEGEIIYEPIYKYNKFVQIIGSKVTELIATIKETFDNSYKYPLNNPSCVVEIKRIESDKIEYSIYQDSKIQPGIYVKNEILNPEDNIILYYDYSGTEEVDISIPIFSNYTYELENSTDTKKIESNKLVDKIIPNETQYYKLTQSVSCGAPFSENKISELSVSLRKWDEPGIEISNVLGYKDNDDSGNYPIISLPTTKELYTSLRKVFDDKITKISVLDSKNNELSSDSGVIYELIVSSKDNSDTIISLDDNNKYRSEFDLRIVIPEQNNSNEIENIILLDEANSLESIKDDTIENHTLIVSTVDRNSNEVEHKFKIQSSKDPVATLIRLDKIIQETDIELIEEPNSGSLVPNIAYIAVEKPKSELIEAEINVNSDSTEATLTILHSLDLDDIIEYSADSDKEIKQVNDYNLQIKLDSDSNDVFLGEEITIENNGLGKYNNGGKCEYLNEDGSKIELDSNISIKYPKNILNRDKTQNYIISKNKDIVQKEKYLESPIVAEYIYTKEDLVNGIILFHESKKEDIYKVIIDDKDFIFTVEDTINNKYIPSSSIIEENTEYTLTVSIYLKDLNNFVSDAFFSDCSNLNNIILPYGINTIGQSMFKGCNNLDVVGIPYSVSSIGAQAFYNCTKLITLAIPDSISSIGDEAFSGCSQLAHIVIPNSVTEIGNKIFNRCINLYDLIIGEGISKIPYNTFTGCSKLSVIFFVHNLPEIVNQPSDKTGFDGIETLEIKYGGNEFEKEQYRAYYSKYENNISNKIILRNNSNNNAGIINLNPEFFNLLVTITVKVPSFTAASQFMSVCALYKKNSQGEGGFDYINFNWADNGVYTDSSPGGYWYKSWDVYERDYLRVKILKEDRRDYMTFYFHINSNGEKSLPFRAFHNLASSGNPYGNCPSYRTGYISLPSGLERIGSRSLDACGFKLLLFPRGLKKLGTASVFNNSKLKSAIFYPNGELIQFGTSYNSKTDYENSFAYNNIKDALTYPAYSNSDWAFSVFAESKGLISIEIPEFWDNTYEGTIPAYSFYNCTNLRYVGFLGNNPNKPYYLGKRAFKNCKKLYSDIIIYYARLYQFCFEECDNLRNLIIRYKISFETTENYYDYFKNSNYLSHLFVENFANSVFPESISNFVIDSIQGRKLFDLTIHTKEVCRESYRDLGFKKIGNNIEREFNISQDILKLKITQKAVPYSTLKIGDIEVIPRLTGVDTELTRCLGIHSSGYAINSGMNESGDNWNIITIELNNAVEGGSIIKDGKLNLEIVKIGDSNLFPNLSFIDSGIISNETEENLTTISAWIKIDESYTKKNNVFYGNTLKDNYYILLHNKNQNGDIKETWALGYIRGWTGLKIDDSNNVYTHNVNSGYTVNIGNEENPILIERVQVEDNYSYDYNPSIDVIQCEPIFEGGEWKLGEEVVINSCFNESIFNNNEYCKLNIPDGNIEFTKEGLSATEPSITSEYDADISDGANTDFPKLKVYFKLSNEAYLESPAKITYSDIGIDCWKVDPTGDEIFVEDNTTSEVFELTETYTQPNYITPKFNIELWLMDSEYEESNKNNEAENNGEESL